MTKTQTEKVTRNIQTKPGQYGTETFWIAYPMHVLGFYGHMEDRIAHATGTGRTRREALANAERKS